MCSGVIWCCGVACAVDVSVTVQRYACLMVYIVILFPSFCVVVLLCCGLFVWCV